MAKLKDSIKTKLSKQNSELIIDSRKLVGGELSEVDKGILGQAIVETIVDRSCDKNVDVDGRPFKAYSKEYKKSVDFRAFGKSSSDKDMKLTGDMLGTLDVKRIEGDNIVIGWQDSTNNAKAYNHNTGDTVPKREFLGMRESELSKLKDEFEPKALKPTDESNISDLFKLIGRIRTLG